MANHIGIDVSKQKFDVCLLTPESEKHRVFHNNEGGFGKLCCWLETHNADGIHACMEATGSYWLDLAEYLFEQGIAVSVVNPYAIKSFARSSLLRSKTDKIDAAAIAEFCKLRNPRKWDPDPPCVKELRQVTRRIQDLKDENRRDKNRLKNVGDSERVKQSIENCVKIRQAEIDDLTEYAKEIVKQNKEIQEKAALLKSIDGIGEETTLVLLGEIGDESRYDSGRQLAAHAGLTPALYESGSSIRGKVRISRVGNKFLRSALYLPALTAMRFNKPLREFAKRLESNGKQKKVIICAVMRKLLHQVFGVLKNRSPFDPEYSLQNP